MIDRRRARSQRHPLSAPGAGLHPARPPLGSRKVAKPHVLGSARRAGTLCLLPLALAGTSLRAQTAAEAPQVVVTGTRLPLTASGLAQNVTIIDQQQIQQAHPARIEDILARATGAYVDQAGRTGGFASMYMRGAENSHLLIMLDGVKLNDPTTTRGSAYDLSSIDIDTIERIEVLRGPASAVYGGEALAGVVHIITRRAPRDGLAGSAYGALGGGQHRKLGGTVSFGQAGFQAQIGAGRSEEGDAGSAASLRLNTLSASLRFAPGGTLQGEIFANRNERKSSAFPDDSGGERLAVNRVLTTRDATDQSYGVRFSAGDPRRVQLQGGLSVFDRQERADNAAVDGGVRFPVPAFVSDTDFRRRNIHLTATHEVAAGTSVLVGLERQTEDGSLTSVGDFFGLGFPQELEFALDRKTTAVFAEARVKLSPSVAAQIGVRRDKVQGLDAVTTPHLGLVWELPGGATTVKANYNEGFKPPSFFALGFPIGGNPELRPERSKNLELTLAQRFAAGSSFEVSVFQTNYKDLVDFDGATFQNINRGTIVVKGIEPSLKLQFGPRWRAELGLTLLNIDERDGLQPLRNRPERKASASLGYEIDARSSLFAGLNHSGRFLDRSNPTGDIGMPGFTTLDLGYSVRFDKLQFKLSVDNLLAKDYEQFVGFAAQGRRLRASLRGSF